MPENKIDWESRRDGFEHRPSTSHKPNNAINWIFWGHLKDIKQWEACALSLNINPDDMQHHPQGWMGGPGGGPIFKTESFPSKEAKLEFDRRLLMLNRIANGNHAATVNPGEFAALCLHLKFECIPPELVAMAVTPKATELDDWLLDPIPYAQACETLGATSPELALWIYFGDLSAWRTTKQRFHESELEKPASVGDAIQRLMTLKVLLSKSEVEAFNLDQVERYVSFETAAGLIKTACQDATHEAEVLEEWRRIHRILSDPQRRTYDLPQIAAFVPGNSYATKIEDGLVMESQIKIFIKQRCSEVPPVVPQQSPRDFKPWETLANEWVSEAQSRAREIIKENKARDLYPDQLGIADQIAKEFRAAGRVGTDGKPISGAYIKRHALKGISSAINKQLSTRTTQGK